MVETTNVNWARVIALVLGVSEAKALDFCDRVAKYFPDSCSSPTHEEILGCLKTLPAEREVTPRNVALFIRKARQDSAPAKVAQTTQHPKAKAPGQHLVRKRTRPIGDRPAGRPPPIFHDTRWAVDGMRKCPHGVVHGMKCAICDPEDLHVGE